jgi:hypothetical protein
VLASWFRLKYPHVTIGAVASSAPILQFDYITPWSSFYDGVSQDFKVTKSHMLLYVGFKDWNLFFFSFCTGSVTASSYI